MSLQWSIKMDLRKGKVFRKNSGVSRLEMHKSWKK